MASNKKHMLDPFKLNLSYGVKFNHLSSLYLFGTPSLSRYSKFDFLLMALVKMF